MKATITSTDRIVRLDTPDNLVRVWEGETEDGLQFIAYIGLLQAVKGEDSQTLENRLLKFWHSPATTSTQQLIEQRDEAVRHCRAEQQALLYHPFAG